MRAAVVVISALALAGCKDPAREAAAGSAATPGSAAPAALDAVASPWPALVNLPVASALRVITLPAKAGVPRFEVGGPVILGDLAVVASSQLGFAAVDWRRGTLAWTRPAGGHVAPPVVHGDGFVLIGSCVTPPELPEGELLLGCLRRVTPAGTDTANIAIHGGGAALEEIAGARGPQQLASIDDHTLRWQRGDRAVTVDLKSGIATPASATAASPAADEGPPPLPVPGIGLLGADAREAQGGGRVLAVRLDTTLRHDYVVRLAGNGDVVWVHPLPEVPRADPIGVVFAPGAVVVFHDGETVTVLPDLSAAPTPAGSARRPSQNPTP